MKNTKTRSWIIYGLLLVVLVFIIGSQLSSAAQEATSPDTLTTSEFTSAVDNNEVIEVTYNAVSGTLSGYYNVRNDSGEIEQRPFTATYVGEDSLNEMMSAHPEINYNVSVSDPNFWVTILSYGIPILFLGLLIWFVYTQFSQANKNQMNFGKSKAKKAIAERPKTRFKDVAGIDEAVEELEEVKDFLANPGRFQEMGAKIPRGVLLVGPPGTGKTLLARAVAGEAGVPFFSISGSDFVEMFVGVGASRVRDLFEKAKESAPSIIFIDEIDAVGRQRGAGLGGGHDEREQTLNQLLVEMDGFEENSSVILIAATNRVDILDPALLRPGRFDRRIVVDRPDLKGREQILRVHAQGKPLAHSVDLEAVAKLTPGFTGADLANLMNEAALLATRRSKRLITMSELSEAMEREIAGPERKGRVITDKEKRIIAYHESGHALVGHVLENSDPVHKISIISRGQALGYTLSLPGEDHFLNSREEMFDDLAVFLGGRVAEEVFCNDITTGASNDLERATKMARQMVTRFGMTEELGPQVYGDANHEVFLGRDYGATPDYSEETAKRIDNEVAKIMRKAHDRAHAVLEERSEQMELMAKVLLERETVEGEALEALLNDTWDDYIEHEEEILARKAEELRKQEEEDERRRAEAAQAAALPQAPTDSTGPAGALPSPDGIVGSIPEKATDSRYTLEDVFAGRVKLEDLVSRQAEQRKQGEQPPETSGQTQQGEQPPVYQTQVELPPVNRSPDEFSSSERTMGKTSEAGNPKAGIPDVDIVDTAAKPQDDAQRSTALTDTEREAERADRSPAAGEKKNEKDKGSDDR